ncbi:hypothetical protein F5B18DRAFT_651614 [Nemania serpens]|nr:hypothetical protein F5B18DRAFT_651614 [Nemania serpens]
MHLSSLIAGAGLVAITNAILLPPDLVISGDANADDVVTTLPAPVNIPAGIAHWAVPHTHTVNLQCPGCFQIGRMRMNIPSHLKLDFSVESTDGVDRFTLNGYELYPNPDPLRNTLTAPVLPDIPDRRPGALSYPRLRGGPKRPQRGQPLGFAMETGAVATKNDEDLQLIKLDIQIIEVGDVLIRHIPDVHVKLVKTPDGKLIIGSIGTTRSPSEETDIRGNEKECSTTLCRWKAMVFQKLSPMFSLKGCGGSARPQHHPEGEHRHGPHPSHMSHRHGWGHGLGVFVMRILFPVLIGIVAGISASLIGIMVGTFVVFLWRLLFRRSYSRSSHRCRYAHKAAESEDAVDEEKSGLLNESEQAEAPPAYAEAGLAIPEDKKPANEV